jgi:hypothetical protein
MKSRSSLLTRSLPGPLIALALAASVGSAHAASFNFLFNSQGFGISTPCNTPNCVQGSAVGQANDVGNAIPGSWASSLDFTALLTTGTASGTWQFFDLGPTSTNDLFGTFTATFNPNAATPAAAISYKVTGGGGLFANATGSGSSALTVIDADLDYTESGVFAVSTVPEPADAAMWFAGLAIVGWGVRRRGR